MSAPGLPSFSHRPVACNNNASSIAEFLLTSVLLRVGVWDIHAWHVKMQGHFLMWISLESNAAPIRLI